MFSFGLIQTLAGRLSPRIYWTVVDQIVSSFSNLVFIAVVARTTSVEEFGAFSLTYLLYGFVLGAGRAMGGEILLLRAVRRPSEVKADSERLLVVAACLGIIAGAVVLGASLLTSDTVGATMRALAVVFPILTVQDALRYCFFASGKPGRAVFNDSVWALAQLAGFAALLLVYSATAPGDFILIWAAGAGAAVVVGLCQAQLSPGRRALRVRREDSGRVRSFLADFVLMTGTGYLAIYAVAGVAGLAAAGALRGATFLFGPFDAVIAGLRILVLPDLGRAAAHGTQNMLSKARRIALAFATVACVYGVVLVLTPRAAGRLVLGETWDAAKPLLIAFAIVYTARMVAIPALEGLRALGGGRRLVQLRAVSAAVTFAAMVLGGATGGASGAAIGMAVAWCVEAVLWWLGFLQGTRSITGDGPLATATAHER